jgi:hypothetical protein
MNSKVRSFLNWAILLIAVSFAFFGCALAGGSGFNVALREVDLPLPVAVTGDIGTGNNSNRGGSNTINRPADGAQQASAPAPRASGTPTRSVNLSLGVLSTVNIVSGSSVQVSFTASEDGRFRFWSSNNNIAVIAFTDPAFSQCLAGHNTGEDRNFRFERTLITGQTFVFTVAGGETHNACKAHSTVNGNFDIIVRKVN